MLKNSISLITGFFSKFKTYLIASGVFILIMLFSFIGGCQHGKKVKVCPVITTGTFAIHDTTHHYIYDIWPWYVEGKDTTIYQPVPAVVDTAAILRDYFAKHVYDRKWENDTLLVNLNDTISQNRSIGNQFRYKIKTPFTTVNNTVDNSVTYKRYLYGGVSMPVYPFKSYTISNINYLSLEGIYAYPKGYFRANWTPFNNAFEIGTGVKFLQFKK